MHQQNIVRAYSGSWVLLTWEGFLRLEGVPAICSVLGSLIVRWARESEKTAAIGSGFRVIPKQTSRGCWDCRFDVKDFRGCRGKPNTTKPLKILLNTQKKNIHKSPIVL